jgi:cytoskeletal protein CcmA (bactofilin family)
MADSEAIIGQGTFIRGNVRGDGDLNVAGRIEGTIEVRGEVVFEETSIIQSEVTADRIVVRGALAGDLHASDSVVLEAGCKVVGDLDAPRIRIDEGALFRGRIEMGGGEQSPTPARKAAPQARTTPRTAPATPARTAPAPRVAPRARAAEPPPEVEQEQEQEAAPPPPPPPVPKPRKPRATAQAAEATDDGPPPPVVPALRKKSKGAVRKRGAR